MKRLITAAVLIPVVLVLVFLGPRWQWLFTLAVAAVAALAGWEYMALSGRCGANPSPGCDDDGPAGSLCSQL
ncbi:MAG: phosphatidate cytidylyltransferase [Terracidiphilus sp.]